MVNIGGLRRILMDIDGLRWFSGVSGKKLKKCFDISGDLAMSEV